MSATARARRRLLRERGLERPGDLAQRYAHAAVQRAWLRYDEALSYSDIAEWWVKGLRSRLGAHVQFPGEERHVREACQRFAVPNGVSVRAFEAARILWQDRP